jgi:hypothetical protein
MTQTPRGPGGAGASGPLGTLRRLAERPAPDERCELCGAAIPAEHPHLLEVRTRSLHCGCRACGILFSSEANGVWRLVPTRVRLLRDFRLSDEEWESLLVPVGMAFFHRSTPAGRVVALYPSPAGATESLLTLEGWRALEAANPILRELQPDVEALLVNRVARPGAGRAHDHFIAPIDECFRLVGILRMRWRGLSGGQEVWEAIEAFFADLHGRAEVLEGSDA